MKLFEVIPDRLFLLFAGKNKSVYAEALLLLYEQYQESRFGIQYDVMRDYMQELIEAQEESGFTFEAEEEQEQANIDSSGEDVFRLKANALLRRLDKLGWIQVEVRENFRQYIVLPHYASRLLALFKELCENRIVEYQRFAFLTYQLLTGGEAVQRPGFAVLEAERVTQQFMEELRVLVNNMKYHMEQVAAKTSVQEVLDHHFDEYKSKIIDRSYHRLKTSDHVSRYRQKILETVQKWLLDRDWYAAAVEDALRNEFFSARPEAEQGLLAAILSIEEIYRGLDDIFYQIDLRHNQYLRASYDRARYLSQHSHGIDQRLANILEWAADCREQEKKDAGILGELFYLLEINHLTEHSLLSPRKKRGPHQPEHYVPIEIPEELKKQLRDQNINRIKKAINREKVNKYVSDRLGGRREMGMEELAPKTMDEFLYMLYVYLYGYDGMACYKLVRGEGNRILTIAGYRFHDRRIVAIEKEGVG